VFSQGPGQGGYSQNFYHPTNNSRSGGAMRISVPPIVPAMQIKQQDAHAHIPSCGKGGGAKREFQYPNSNRDTNETKGLVTPRFYQDTLRNDEVDFVAMTTPHLTVGRVAQTPRATAPLGQEDEPIVPALTPRYDPSLGFYVDVDQHHDKLAIPSSPRVPNTPRVQSVRGCAPKVMPVVVLKSKTLDSLCVEWSLSSASYPNGVFLCIDNGKQGAFTPCFFWSAMDLRSHMREKGRVPIVHIITNLKGATTYRICLCEAAEDGTPILHASRDGLSNPRNKLQTFTTAGTKAAPPRKTWNNPAWKPKWKPTPEWQPEWQPEQLESPRHRFSQVRYGASKVNTTKRRPASTGLF